MGHRIFAVPVPVGRLWIMPCPEGPDDFDAMRVAGVTCVVSMLPAAEAAELGMTAEAQHCAGHDMAFVNHPIADFGLPDAVPFRALITDLSARLRADEGIAVHCRAGIGRSGTVAACILIGLGYRAMDAVRIVSDARGVSIPDTVEQGGFIAAFEQVGA